MIKFRSVVSIASLAAVATALLLPSPVSAAECQSEGYRWTLRGVAAKIDSDGDPSITEVEDPFERLKFDLNSGEAVGAELEYRVNCPVGVAFGLLAGNLDSMAVFDTEFEWLMDHDDVDFSLLSLGVNFHLSPRSRADFFIGPFVGVVDYEDVDFDTTDIPLDADLDGDTVVGLNAGVDIPFSDSGPWAFTAGLRYLATSADGPGFSIDVDPLIASVGIAYRWNGKKCGPCGPTAEEVAAEEAAAAAAAAAEESAAAAAAAAAEEAAAAAAAAAAEEAAAAAAEEAAGAAAAAAAEEAAAAAAAMAAVEREVCHFSTNKARVSNICKAKLDEVALKLKQDPALGARIVGHADSTGNDRINDPLSVQRAEAVSSYLVDRHGIDAGRIEIAGAGSREPTASNDTADGRAENRRAVVVISLG